MIELAFRVFANLEDDRVEPIANPTDGAMLSGEIRTLVSVLRMKENLLSFLETDSAAGISPECLALPLIEVESH